MTATTKTKAAAETATAAEALKVAEDGLEKLRARERELAGRLEDNRAKRRDLALAASEGDAAAKKSLDALNADDREVEREREDLGFAVEAAEQRQVDARARVAAELRAAKLAEFNKLLAERLEKAAALEKALRHANSLIEEMDRLGSEAEPLHKELAPAAYATGGALRHTAPLREDHFAHRACLFMRGLRLGQIWTTFDPAPLAQPPASLVEEESRAHAQYAVAE